MKKEHKLYLASPLCFYPNGYTLWHGYRKLAEYYGFTVTMPNDNKLVEEGARSLKRLKEKIDTTKMHEPSFMMVLTANGDYAYQRPDEVWVIPIGSLRE